MRCRDFSHLVLHDSEHFSDCEIDAASEFVLVIDLEPSGKDLDYVWFEDFCDF